MDSIIVQCNDCGAKNKIPAAKQHLGPKCGKCGQRLNISQNVVPVELSDTDFQDFIQDIQLPALVDFFSPTCGPCRMLAPVIDSLARKYFGRLIVAKLDTSRNQMTAMHFQVRGVPTLLFFKNGQPIDQMVGAAPEQDITQKIEAII